MTVARQVLRYEPSQAYMAKLAIAGTATCWTPSLLDTLCPIDNAKVRGRAADDGVLAMATAVGSPRLLRSEHGKRVQLGRQASGWRLQSVDLSRTSTGDCSASQRLLQYILLFRSAAQSCAADRCIRFEPPTSENAVLHRHMVHPKCQCPGSKVE